MKLIYQSASEVLAEEAAAREHGEMIAVARGDHKKLLQQKVQRH